tara:strand:+ start:1221 stop:2390 length:1170 start_codon:yes stop_codon:yes gene_type:complete
MNFIRKIFSTQWKYGAKTLYFVILISFSLFAYYHLSIGFRMSGDSFSYSLWADDLIKLKFNLYNYYNQNTYIRPNFIYTIPVLIIALLKLLFETGWQYSFMILNLILVLFSLIIFSKILLLLNVRAIAISLAIPFLTLSVDLLIWPRFILSDTIFAFLVLLTVFIIVKSIVKENFYYLSLILLLTLMFLTRPTSVPYIFAIISFVLISKLNINYNPKLLLLFIFSLFFVAPFVLAVMHQLMKIYLISYSEVSNWIKQVEIGMIIHDRPKTWVDAPNTFAEIIHLYFTRMIFFFIPYVESFSKIHILLNLLQAFFVFISITIWLFLGENCRSVNKSIFVILLIAISVATFHSLTLIDYDWRYRFPLIIPLLIILPISIEIILRKIVDKNF